MESLPDFVLASSTRNTLACLDQFWENQNVQKELQRYR